MYTHKSIIKPTLTILLTAIWLIGLPQTPKYSNEFMAIGVGARAMSMGNSVVSFGSNAPSAYWNPAALNQLKPDMQLSLMHSPYFSGLANYNFAALAFKSGNSSALSFTIVRLAVDNIPNTLELIDADGNFRYDRIKSFSASDIGFLASYSKKLKNENISLGGSLKIIRRKAGDFASSWGFGMDLSALINSGNWKFGIVGRDISTTYNSWVFNSTQLQNTFLVTGNSIPETSTEITLPRLIIGVGRSFRFSENVNMIAEINVDITSDKQRNTLLSFNPFSIDPHMGVELNFGEKIFIRGGVHQFQYTSINNDSPEIIFQPTIGAGIKIGEVLVIDYALSNPGSYSPSLLSHIISINFNIRKNSNPS